jgi:hypothetical protein
MLDDKKGLLCLSNSVLCWTLGDAEREATSLSPFPLGYDVFPSTCSPYLIDYLDMISYHLQSLLFIAN